MKLERELVDVLSIEEIDYNLLRQEGRLERFLQRKLKKNVQRNLGESLRTIMAGTSKSAEPRLSIKDKITVDK